MVLTALPCWPKSLALFWLSFSPGRLWEAACGKGFSLCRREEKLCYCFFLRLKWKWPCRETVESPPWRSSELPGQGPEQSALDVCAWEGVGPDGPRGPFSPQPFCVSVILLLQIGLVTFTVGLLKNWFNIKSNPFGLFLVLSFKALYISPWNELHLLSSSALELAQVCASFFCLRQLWAQLRGSSIPFVEHHL